MLVCSYTVECFVMMSMYDSALCNECLFSESRDEIPVRGSLSHPKIFILGCE
jgi:hypothetical protein